MKMLVLILNDETRVDEILLTFLKAGVRGATVIDSVGMGGILGVKIPFLKKMENLVQIEKPDNKTIFAVIRDEEILKTCIGLLREKLMLQKPGTGFMFTIPVSDVYGTREMTDKE